jgi:small subunit ribosomal protein S9
LADHLQTYKNKRLSADSVGRPKHTKADQRVQTMAKKESTKTADRGGLDIAPAASAPAPVATAVRPVAAPKAAKGGWWWGVGRRKRAVARVRIRPAKGDSGIITIQCTAKKTKTVEQYFAEDRDRMACYAPLKLVGVTGKIEVFVRLNGGGFMGQAAALRLGLSRALKDYDPALEAALRGAGMLTRDAREVERKKYGQSGARRRFQFSKR